VRTRYIRSREKLGVDVERSRRLQHRDWLERRKPINKSKDIWLQAPQRELPNTRAPSLLALRVTARETRSLPPASPGVPTARPTLRDTFTALHRTVLHPHRVPLHPTRNHARSLRNAAAAAGCAGPKLCARPVHRLHALEGYLDRQRLAVTYRCCTFRVYGACVPKRRFVVPVESESGYADWRDRGLQCEGQGYSDRASRGQEIRRRVSWPIYSLGDDSAWKEDCGAERERCASTQRMLTTNQRNPSQASHQG
jgi:hypothetical protein